MGADNELGVYLRTVLLFRTVLNAGSYYAPQGEGLAMAKGKQRYVGSLFDLEVIRLQKEHKKRTGNDMPYSEVTDRIVFNPPVFVAPDGKKKKKKEKFSFGGIGLV